MTPQTLPAAAATGLGSMPFTDADAAMSRVRRFFPQIPYWPQLPRRGASEGLILQVLDFPVACGLVAIEGDRATFLNRRGDWPERLAQCYETIMAAEAGDAAALSRFRLNPSSAAGFFRFLDAFADAAPAAEWVKGQVVGPLTLGFQAIDQEGRMAFYDDTLRDLLLRVLALHARWQCRQLSQLGRPVILFVDDPSIAAYGRYSHITLEREAVLQSLDHLFEAIHGEGALAGLHSCDAADWTLVTGSRADVMSLDAYQFGHTLAAYAGDCRDFIRRGGTVAWGIVPTMDVAGEETVEGLCRRLDGLWASLAGDGLDAAAFRRRSLITPACGTGLLSPALADTIFTLTRGVSDAIREARG